MKPLKLSESPFTYNHVGIGDVVVLESIDSFDLSFAHKSEYVDELYIVKSRGDRYLILSPLFSDSSKNLFFTCVTVKRL